MIRPAHLFLSMDGDLHDTRDSDWASKPLRRAYAQHSEVKTVAQFKACLRAGSCVWPGCYPMAFLTHDCEYLCFKCARRNFRNIAESIRDSLRGGWRVVDCLIAEAEESDVVCDQCNTVIAECFPDLPATS